MKVKLLRSVKDSDAWRCPGMVINYPDNEARRLIFLGAAEKVVLQEKTEIDNKSENVNKEKDCISDLLKIDGVNNSIAQSLISFGFKTTKDVSEADSKELVKVEGIGYRNVGKIQESADDLNLSK